MTWVNGGALRIGQLPANEPSADFRRRQLREILRKLPDEANAGLAADRIAQVADEVRRRHQNETVERFLHGLLLEEIGKPMGEEVLPLAPPIYPRLDRVVCRIGALVTASRPVRAKLGHTMDLVDELAFRYQFQTPLDPLAGKDARAGAIRHQNPGHFGFHRHGPPLARMSADHAAAGSDSALR